MGGPNPSSTLYSFSGCQPFLAYIVNFIVWLEITWLLPSLTNNKHRAFNNFEKTKSTVGDTDIFKGRNPNESHPPIIFNFSSALSRRVVKYFFLRLDAKFFPSIL